MKFFPYAWGGDKEVEAIQAPVGESCLLCEEPVLEGDLGVTMPFLGPLDQPVTERAHHRVCLLKNIFGPDYGRLFPE
jgi:hypothetical protein